jgi:hypothetical protein
MSSASFHRPHLPINRRLKVALCLTLCLIPCLPYPTQSQTADEAALRALAERFFAAWPGEEDQQGVFRPRRLNLR